MFRISQPKTKMFRIVLPDHAATVVGGINPLSRSVRLYAVQMSHDYSTGRWWHQSVEPVGPLYAVQMSHDDCGFIIGLKTLVLCTVPAEAPGLLVCLAERFFSCRENNNMSTIFGWLQV